MSDWEKTQIRCQCGGIVEIIDWGDKAENPEWRFETSCDKCHQCDPNGYATRKEALDKAPTFFGVKT